MRILIIGGSGFVSGALARMALQRGHEVWAVTRGQRPLPDDVRPLLCDRNDASAFRAAVTGTGVRFDAALDCVCHTPQQAEIDLSVLPAVTDRLIVLSTDSVYHPDHKRVPQNEQADHYMDDGGYGAGKRQMELVLTGSRTSLRWTIFRPGHIYGAGSQLGCFPQHSRQSDLLSHMLAGKPIRLVGGGAYLIHPIYVGDMARVMLDCIDNPLTFNELYCIGGPDIIPNRRYYEILAGLLNVPVTFEDIPEDGYLSAHPQYSGHLCNRAYDLTRLAATGIQLPATTLTEGLREQAAWCQGLCNDQEHA